MVQICILSVTHRFPFRSPLFPFFSTFAIANESVVILQFKRVARALLVGNFRSYAPELNLAITRMNKKSSTETEGGTDGRTDGRTNGRMD